MAERSAVVVGAGIASADGSGRAAGSRRRATLPTLTLGNLRHRHPRELRISREMNRPFTYVHPAMLP